MIDKRIALFRNLAPMKVAADAMRHRSEFLRADQRKFVTLGRQRLMEIVPGDIAHDVECLEALDALLSFEFWLRLTRDQRLSIKRASAVVRVSVFALIDAAARPRRAGR